MPFGAHNITKTFSIKIQCFMEIVVWAIFCRIGTFWIGYFSRAVQKDAIKCKEM